MDDQNPYAPPAADLTPEPTDHARPWYHPVAQTKFALLYFLTLGLYAIFWFYRHWKLIKAREGSNIWPVPRGIFAIFFVHALFRHIHDSADQRNLATSWRPSTLANWYVALSIISFAADRIAQQSDRIGPLDFVSLLCFFAVYFPLRQVQQTINQVNGDPEGHLNDDYPVGTVLVMVLGGLVWLAAVAVPIAVLLGVQV